LKGSFKKERSTSCISGSTAFSNPIHNRIGQVSFHKLAWHTNAFLVMLLGVSLYFTVLNMKATSKTMEIMITRSRSLIYVLVYCSLFLCSLQVRAQQAERYFNKGYKKLLNHDYEAAIIDYNKVISLDSTSTTSFNNRGLAKHGIGNLEGALADYNKAIQLDSTLSEAYNNRGVIRFEMEDYPGAEKDFAKLLQLTPKSADAYYHFGLAEFKLNKYESAIQNYNIAIGIVSYKEVFYNARGEARLALKDFEPALNDFNTAISLNKDYLPAYQNKSLVFIQYGDKEKGGKEFHQHYKLADHNGIGNSEIILSNR
jgi:tetratricopeptide (TPR) repeat protein